MTFQDYLAQMPDVGHLSGLEIYDLQGNLVHSIPAVQGKLGSLKLYHALYQQFSGSLNASAAEQGLTWFAEHVDDALRHVGKHPNIDLLLKIKEQDAHYVLKPILQAA